jgi:hypothetical protein
LNPTPKGDFQFGDVQRKSAFAGRDFVPLDFLEKNCPSRLTMTVKVTAEKKTSQKLQLVMAQL